MTRLPALLGPALASKATAIAGYYLFDEGGSFANMVQAAVGIDIPGMLANFNATRDDEITARLCCSCGLFSLLCAVLPVVSGFAHACRATGPALSVCVT